MLCLCGFELYSRWVPLNAFNSLFSSLTGINWQLDSKYSNNKEMAGLLSTRSKQYANFAF